MSHAPNSLAARDVAGVIHPFTNLRAHEEQGPLVITRGKGVFVYDDDGKEYLEGLAGLWCTSLGFSEQRLIDAATRQMQEMPYTHTFAGRSSEPVIELATELLKIAPAPLSKAFFVNSGSEAIDTTIKIAWYYNNARGMPQKKRVIARRRAYHGITIAAGHVTGTAYARTGFDLPMSDRFFHVTCPSFYRDGLPGESEDAFSTRLAAEVETLIQALGPDTVAAFVAEPVMGAGGVVPPPAGYFEKIQPILKKHDVLMIADEVICGFGRTGNMFACETYGIRPDMMTCAKQLSSAYLPIAAVLLSDDVYAVMADRSQELGNFGMGYTYGGHPVAAAVALETLRIYEADRVVEHVREIAPHFQERLRALARYPLVGEARGVGLIGAIELVADKKTRAQFDPKLKLNAQVVAKAARHGLIVRAIPMDSIGICPPLIIKPAEIDTLFDRLEEALEDAHSSAHLAA